MTNEDLNEIKRHWSNDGCPGVEQAKSDIIRLANEVERLRESCDEITRQYARVCNQSHVQLQYKKSRIPRTHRQRFAPQVLADIASKTALPLHRAVGRGRRKQLPVLGCSVLSKNYSGGGRRLSGSRMWLGMNKFQNLPLRGSDMKRNYDPHPRVSLHHIQVEGKLIHLRAADVRTSHHERRPFRKPSKPGRDQGVARSYFVHTGRL